MFAERIQHRCERQLASVSGAQAPTNNLSGFEIEYYGQVVSLATKLEMSVALHPSCYVSSLLPDEQW